MTNLNSVYELEIHTVAKNVYPVLQLIGSVRSVGILHLSHDSLPAPGEDWKLVLNELESKKLSLPEFPNLLRLEVDPKTTFLHADVGWRILRDLVIQSPRLEELVFSDGWVRPSEHSIPPLSSRKVIEVNGFHDDVLKSVLDRKLAKQVVLRKNDKIFNEGPSSEDILASFEDLDLN